MSVKAGELEYVKSQIELGNEQEALDFLDILIKRLSKHREGKTEK